MQSADKENGSRVTLIPLNDGQLKRFYAEFVSGFCCNRDENDGWERELFARSGFQLILRPDLILFSV